MKYFLVDADSVKAATIINYNVDDSTVGYAIREAQNTYLREILGDPLLDKCVELASSGTIDEPTYKSYAELVDDYIFDYLVAKAQECMLIPISFKIRNIGVSQDSDTNVTASPVEDIEKLQNYWRTISIDKGNRLKCFLKDNRTAFPELETECSCNGCGKKPNLKLEANTNLNI